MTARALVVAAAGLTGLPAAAEAAEPVSLTWGGDVTLGSSYGQPPRAGWPQLAPIAPILRASDITVLNYEGTFAPGARVSRSWASPVTAGAPRSTTPAQ